MRLIRMLRVSHTFTAGEIPVNPYRVVGVGALPRFVRTQPAVRPAARPGEGPCRVDAGSGVAEEAIETGGEKAGTVPKSGAGARSHRFWLVRLVYWLSERLPGRRNPFGLTGDGLRLASTVRPRQGCLRMDGVQVVRNDLSDTDFEVRQAVKSKPVKSKAAAAEAVACDFQQLLPVDDESERSRAANL